MIAKETVKFLALVKLAYPNAYKDIDEISRAATVKMWSAEFQNVSYQIMVMALEKHKRKSAFPPSIADISRCLTDVYWDSIDQYDAAELTGNVAVQRASMSVIKATSQFRSQREASLMTGERAAYLIANERKMIGGDLHDN